jgi:hypothetical protein
MPAVPITSDEQYEKALEVLTRVGGTWQGVGPSTERFLLVSPRLFEALAEAGVVARQDTNKVSPRGKNARKSPKLYREE